MKSLSDVITLLWFCNFFPEPILPTKTSQIRVDGSPHSHTAFPETLADGKLQHQERHSFQHQQNQVGNQKRTWEVENIRILMKIFDLFYFIVNTNGL